MDVSGEFRPKTMTSMLGDHGLINELTRTYKHEQGRKTAMKSLPGLISSHADGSSALEQKKLVASSVNKRSERSNRIANAIKEHVKEKLSLGAKVLQVGGMEKVYMRLFNVREGYRLLKTSQCCLFTTAGPIAGLLFISTNQIAFCSNRSVVKFSSPSGELLRFRYKAVIPLTKIDSARQCENAKKSQKYLQVITEDDFEFWFMGFFNYKSTFRCMQQAISKV